MANYHDPDYDLLDENNCADGCEVVISLCELIDDLLADIKHLELECISARHMLSEHIDPEQGEYLRMDILSDLGRRYSNPAYELFKTKMYSGGDPMEFRDFIVKVQKACEGKYPFFH